MARNCPYPKKNRHDDEAHGQQRGTMSALVGEGEDHETHVKELEQKLQDVWLKLAACGKSAR